MLISVQRWGTSLAIRIPKSFAAKARLREDTDVEISLEGGRIVIAPARRQWKLEELIGAISSANRHGEVQWGDQTGNETSCDAPTTRELPRIAPKGTIVEV